MNVGRRSIPGLLFVAAAMLIAAGSGCSLLKEKPPEYGIEHQRALASERGEVWAIAPAINLSGQHEVDPILQADIAYQQLQTIKGLTVIPVNRVAEVYATLRIERVQSVEQAAVVCDLLGCDAIIVPTVTAYDPYNPPKFGASLQMFRKTPAFQRQTGIDPRALSRAAARPEVDESLPQDAPFVQAVGMYDAANGSVRDALLAYAAGRNDPVGPLGRQRIPREHGPLLRVRLPRADRQAAADAERGRVGAVGTFASCIRCVTSSETGVLPCRTRRRSAS